MKRKILLILPLLLSACAHTELRSASTGKILFRTEMDAASVIYKDNNVSLTVISMDHSKTNAIMGKNFQMGATAVATGIATSGILGLVH